MEKTLQIPVTINNEGGSYWGVAQIFSSCFSQGDTLKEFGDNMTLAIQEYADGINEGFFDIPNTGILNSILKQLDISDEDYYSDFS